MEIFKGRTPANEYKQLMEVLDDVFFSEDSEVPPRDFLSLLPKLYKTQYNPCYNNMCVMEDGIIKGAIGLYPIESEAAGQKLKIGGIGNVAVAKNARSEGHMKTCMKLCLDQMIADGTDFSLLGGQRQRYGFFGYEPAGVGYDFRLDTGNLYRLFGKNYEHPYTARLLEAHEEELLLQIQTYLENLPYKIYHKKEEMFDVLCSWHCIPYVVMDGNDCKGFFTKSRCGNDVNELFSFDNNDIFNVCIAAMDAFRINGVNLNIPSYLTELSEICAAKMNGTEVCHAEMINILNYENFIRGFLGLKVQTETLCDGEIVLLIHGYRQDEQLKITVRNNTVDVRQTTETPDMEINHREAVRMIASLYSADRLRLPANVRSWFPLPFWFSSYDGV